MRSSSRFRLRIPLTLAVALISGAAILVAPAIAATLDGGVLPITLGQTAKRPVTSSSGTVKVSSSNNTVASATFSAGVVTVTGNALGSATITVKDSTRQSTSFKVQVISASVRVLAANCFQCHGTNATGGFKSIATMKAGSIYNQLLRYRGMAPEGNIMAAHVSGYTDAQMRAIADLIYAINH